MADKNEKKKLGDYIEISLPQYGNQTARIWRDDTKDEEQWEQAKAAAKSSGTLIAVKESEKRSGNKSAGPDSEEKLMLRDPVTGAMAEMPRGNLSEARWKALKSRDPADNQINWDTEKDAGDLQVQPETASIKRTVIDPSGRVEDVAYQAPPEVLPAEPSPTNTGRGAATTLSVDEGDATERPVQKPMMTNPGTRTLSVDETQASGPRAFFGNAIKGAVSKEGLQYQPGALPPAPQGEVSMTGIPPEQGMEPQQPLDMTGIPAGTGKNPLEVLSDTATSAGNFASGLPNQPQPGQPVGNYGDRLGDPVDDKFAAAEAAKVAQTGVPTDVGGTPGMNKLQAQQTTTTRVPGSGGSSLEGDLNRSYADQIKFAEKRATEEALASGKIAEAEVAKQQNLQSIENTRAIRAQALVERQDKVQAAQMRAIESLSEQVKIDPSRLWSSRTSQQKADAQLAGFLFGFSGSGAQYVQSLQNEVEKDVQAQLQAAQLTMEGKKAQAAGLGNTVEQLLKQGFQANEAAGVARASILEVHNSKLAEMKARFEGTTAGIRAGEASAALGPARVKAIEDSRTAAAQQANLYAEAYSKRESIAIQKRNAEMKGSGKNKLDATIEGKLLVDIDNLSMLDTMEKAAQGINIPSWSGPAGPLVGSAINSMTPRGVAEDFKAQTDAYGRGRSELMSSIAKGAVGAEEAGRIGGNIAEPFDMTRSPLPGVQAAKARYREAFEKRLQALESMNVDTGQLRDMLKQRGINFVRK